MQQIWTKHNFVSDVIELSPDDLFVSCRFYDCAFHGFGAEFRKCEIIDDLLHGYSHADTREDAEMIYQAWQRSTEATAFMLEDCFMLSRQEAEEMME